MTLVAATILLRNSGLQLITAPSQLFFLSPAMGVEELETLLRIPAHTEEECARIVSSCNSLEYH